MDWLLALVLSLLDTHTLVSLDLALKILGFFSSRQQQTRCIYRNIFMKNKLEYICRHLRHDCVRRDRWEVQLQRIHHVLDPDDWGRLPDTHALGVGRRMALKHVNKRTFNFINSKHYLHFFKWVSWLCWICRGSFVRRSGGSSGGNHARTQDWQVPSQGWGLHCSFHSSCQSRSIHIDLWILCLQWRISGMELCKILVVLLITTF